MDYPVKAKKGTTITNSFHKNLDKSRRKPNKLWVDEGSNFTTDQCNLRQRKNRIYKCIQHIMKEYMLLLKDLLEF